MHIAEDAAQSDNHIREDSRHKWDPTTTCFLLPYKWDQWGKWCASGDWCGLGIRNKPSQRSLHSGPRPPPWGGPEGHRLVHADPNRVWLIWTIPRWCESALSLRDGSGAENSKLKIHCMVLDERRGKQSFSILGFVHSVGKQDWGQTDPTCLRRVPTT